jgi:murein DD-endopeptidase MepM/ murein hydrolase activator NlpD
MDPFTDRYNNKEDYALKNIFLSKNRKIKKNNKLLSSFNSLVGSLKDFKRRLVNRMFWGRSSYHKNISHIVMITITLSIAITGLVSKISAISSSSSDLKGELSIGTDDLLQQGSSLQATVLSEANGATIKTSKYTVQKGETLESIAQSNGVTTDTIRWASGDIPELFFSNRIEEGWILTIPEINGVLYKVRPGQTLDQVIAETSSTYSESNRFNIIEFNTLKAPYDLKGIDKLFIPDGNLKQIGPDGKLDEIPKGVFIDPLSHADCAGYSFSRGFLPYHNGIDLARWPGCPISSVANGIVDYAGWANGGQGYMVRVDHGGGIKTEYFHGNGEIWVKPGERVQQGQPLMMMGSTGNSTGVHLHFILWKDGVEVNPRPYVPYIGDY